MTRAEAFQTMRKREPNGKPIPFSITYGTLDEGRGTGGEIRTLNNLVLAGSSWNLEKNLAFAVKRANGKDFSRGQPVITVKVPLLLRVNGTSVV